MQWPFKDVERLDWKYIRGSEEGRLDLSIGHIKIEMNADGTYITFSLQCGVTYDFIP
jgi:hypothetical protein